MTLALSLYFGVGLVLRLVQRRVISYRRERDRMEDELDDRARLDLFDQLENERRKE